MQSLKFWKLANVTAPDAEGQFRDIVEDQVSIGELKQNETNQSNLNQPRYQLFHNPDPISCYTTSIDDVTLLLYIKWINLSTLPSNDHIYQQVLVKRQYSIKRSGIRGPSVLLTSSPTK